MVVYVVVVVVVAVVMNYKVSKMLVISLIDFPGFVLAISNPNQSHLQQVNQVREERSH